MRLSPVPYQVAVAATDEPTVQPTAEELAGLAPVPRDVVLGLDPPDAALLGRAAAIDPLAAYGIGPEAVAAADAVFVARKEDAYRLESDNHPLLSSHKSDEERAAIVAATEGRIAAAMAERDRVLDTVERQARELVDDDERARAAADPAVVADIRTRLASMTPDEMLSYARAVGDLRRTELGVAAADLVRGYRGSTAFDPGERDKVQALTTISHAAVRPEVARARESLTRIEQARRGGKRR